MFVWFVGSNEAHCDLSYCGLRWYSYRRLGDKNGGWIKGVDRNGLGIEGEVSDESRWLPLTASSASACSRS